MKLFCLSHPSIHLIKYRLWKKNFLSKIHRYIQTFAFKVLQECDSCMSRNGPVQMFFLAPNRSTFAGKSVKSKMFLTVFKEHIIFNVKWVDIR